MTLIQTILIIFFIYAALKVAGRWRAGELTLGVTLVWLLFWALAAIVVFLPDITFRLARFVGIGRGADLVVYVSLALLFFIVFRLTVKFEHLNRDITKLTRKLALAEQEKKDSDLPSVL